jgi:uncharacterized damage-inducible protein DinB
MKTSAVAILFLMTVCSLNAQSSKPQGLTSQPNQTDSAMTAETRRVFQSVETDIIKTAREMPESSYTFTPIKGVRTFGELMAHIANVQGTLCGNINGDKLPKAGGETASKDGTIKQLENSVRSCQEAFDELSSENAQKMVQTPVGQLTHIAALEYVITHASEEYGQLSVYLWLNHLTPPSTDQPKTTL